MEIALDKSWHFYSSNIIILKSQKLQVTPQAAEYMPKPLHDTV